MASSSVVWPNVIVKTGPFVVGGRKVVKAEWSDTCGELLVHCSGLDCVCMYFPLAILCVFSCIIYVQSCCTTTSASQIEGGIIKGISRYKTARSSAHSSFVRLFVRLYSSLTPNCVSSRLVL